MNNRARQRAPAPARAAQLVHEAVGSDRAPTVVAFQVTDRCNYDCPHCYQNHDHACELTAGQIDAILADVADAGVLFLTLMGGEFFMRRDADEILGAARRRSFAVKLLTTGHHIDDRRADLIAELGAIEVHMSVYSANHRVHDRLTLTPGSFQRTIAAAKRLRARGVPVSLQSPVMAANAAELAGVKRLAAGIGAGCAFDPKVTSRRDGDPSPTGLRANDDTLRAFYRDRDIDLLGPFARAENIPLAPTTATPCYAGRAVAAIDPQGNVSPCNQLSIHCGNARERSFADIWRSSPQLQRVRSLTWAAIDSCRDCALRRYCSRCHAMALREDGAIDGPSLEACRHAVIVRDELRARGVIDPSETALPPTWGRVLAMEDATARHGVRPAALRVLPD